MDFCRSVSQCPRGYFSTLNLICPDFPADVLTIRVTCVPAITAFLTSARIEASPRGPA